MSSDTYDSVWAVAGGTEITTSVERAGGRARETKHSVGTEITSVERAGGRARETKQSVGGAKAHLDSRECGG